MNTLKLTSALLLAAITCPACVTEPQSCDLDPNASDPAIAMCATEESATCVVDTHPQCRGMSCIKIQGADGFCAVDCRGDAECDAHERCVEVTLASGRYHCVAEQYLN